MAGASAPHGVSMLPSGVKGKLGLVSCQCGPGAPDPTSACVACDASPCFRPCDGQRLRRDPGGNWTAGVPGSWVPLPGPAGE